jgi:hypothetical protein
MPQQNTVLLPPHRSQGARLLPDKIVWIRLNHRPNSREICGEFWDL